MSQCTAILAVLTDGRPHRMEEIHQRIGTCRLNSRIADLRKHGHVIECDKTGGVYTYQLVVSTSEAGGDRRASAAALFGVPPASGVSVAEGTGCLPVEPETPVYIEGQLSVFDALGAVA